MNVNSTYYTTALKRGVHITKGHIETRRNGNQWHAPLRTFDADGKAALAQGQVVRNVEQGFDAFPARPRRINVRYSPSA